MDTSKSSNSLRNLAVDEPVLSNGGRTGGEHVHESLALASDESNAPLATTLKSHPIFPGSATVAIKFNPTCPRNVSTSVIQSSWIQRLKPFSQNNTSMEEPAKLLTKENPVCTHFTRDFSSCSKRLDKPSQHTGSSSWPPRALPLQGVEHSPMALGKPADITEGYGKAALNTLDIDCQSVQAPSNDITHSSDAGSRTGNLSAQQRISSKQASVVESFLPCALNRENPTFKKLNDLKESESGDGLTQKTEDVRKVNSVKEYNAALQMKALAQTEEGGSCGASKGDMCAPVLSLSACRAAHSSGASADADDKIFVAKSSKCCMGSETSPLKTSFVEPGCEVAFPTVVMSENRVSVDKAWEDWQHSGGKAAQTGLLIGSNAGNVEFLQTVSKCKQLEESVAKPYILINLSNVKASSKFHLSPKNSHLSEAFSNAHEKVVMTTCAVHSRTVAASASLKKDNFSKRMDSFYSRETSIADLQNPHYSKGGISRSTLPVGSLHEDAARSRIREISMGEYWNSWLRLLEEPQSVKPPKAGSPLASPQEDCVVENYHKNLFHLSLIKAKLDARPAMELEDYGSRSPHKHVSKDAENFGSCNLPQQMHASSSRRNHKFSNNRMGSSETKTGWGEGYHASADRSSHCSLKGVHECQKYDRCHYRGATDRVDSQLHYEDSGLHRSFLGDGSSPSRMRPVHPSQEVCKNERTGEGSCLHEVWIQRWHSPANFSATAGKATSHVPHFSRSLSSDEFLKSCSGTAGFPLIPSTGTFEHNLTDSGRGSNRYTEASGTRIDSGSASTTRSLLTSRNFAAFQCGFMGSCAESKAIVYKSAGKLPERSLQNRVFGHWPCVSPKFVKCEGLPEDEKIPESDKSKAMEHHISDS